MALIVTLNNCGHINIARANSVPIISVTLDELQDPVTERDSPVLQRLKWLLKDYVAGGGTPTKAAFRAHLLGQDA